MNVYLLQLMVSYFGGTWRVKNQFQLILLKLNKTFLTLKEKWHQKYLELLLLSTIQMRVLLNIWLVLSKVTSSRLIRESKLKLVQDLVVMQEVNILAQFTQSGEILFRLSTSSLLVIGQQRFGMMSSNNQLCKLGITQLILLTDAGHHKDVVFSTWLELMVSWRFGTSITNKMKLHTLSKLVISHWLQSLWTQIWLLLVMLRVPSQSWVFASLSMRQLSKKKK